MAQTAYHLTARVLPGHRVEFSVPEMPEGTDVLVSWSPAARQEERELRLRFQVLADQWRRETALLSSVTQIAMHPAYQQIIGMGEAAIPMILEQLRESPGHWFWALRAISGEDPTQPEDRGRLPAMAAAWLRWGEARGFLR